MFLVPSWPSHNEYPHNMSHLSDALFENFSSLDRWKVHIMSLMSRTRLSLYCLEDSSLVVEAGGKISLSCLSPSSSPWLLCTWRLTSELHCAVLTGLTVLPVDCEGEDGDQLAVSQPEVTLAGDRRSCDLELSNVSRHTEGVWSCSLASLQAGQLVTSHTAQTDLQVTSRGILALAVQGEESQQLVSDHISEYNCLIMLSRLPTTSPPAGRFPMLGG